MGTVLQNKTGVFDHWCVFNFLLCLHQQWKGKKPPLASSGVTGKGKTLSSQPKKADPAAGVKRTPSSECIARSRVQLWVPLQGGLGGVSVPPTRWRGAWCGTRGRHGPVTESSFLICWWEGGAGL